jgi:hypothetical protein
MMKRIREVSPHLKARIAGVLFLLVILTAAFTEFFVRGRLGFTADLVVGVIEISGIIVVTLLFYDIFRTVNRSLSLLAASFNFVGLTLELLQFNPRGRDDRNRISRTLFPPDGPPPLPEPSCLEFWAHRWHSPVGVGWSFCHRSLHTSCPPTIWPCLLGEASLSLWLVVMGVNVQRWKEQASA